VSAPARILVVEDEGIVGLDIQSKLEAMGYDVPSVVSTAADAISAAERMRPDLVLMDIQLEGDMDGVDAARRIGDDYEIPVVYLTAYSDETTLARAKTAQTFGYLLKPFEERELYTTVEIALFRHRAETDKARLEERVRQAEKMEAVGQLSAGIAHHFNLMLQGIIGNLDLASMSATDDLRPFLHDATYDAERAARLIRQLMLFHKDEEQSTHTRLDALDLLREITDVCQSVFPRDVEFHVDVPERLPVLRGHRDQLRQCIVNLCANARDAVSQPLPGGGKSNKEARIELRAAALRADQTPSKAPPGAGSSIAYLRVDVVDTGIGMDAATRERIFEPFFTTKTIAGPAGLGLAAAFGIVRDHDGWIECVSEPEQGTTMSVFLPLGRSSPDDQPAIPVTDSIATTGALDLRPLRGEESVLVIADVDRFRKILDLMYERHGYKVHLGRDPRDGVELFRHEHEQIDLVVLGLTQPGAPAEDLLTQMLKISSRARVLVVTAQTRPLSVWKGAAGVLMQPFNTYQLLKTTRQILDR
jgi:signal transduction histidine kinase